MTTHQPAETIVLPGPARRGGRSLEEALAARRSVRDFTAEPLSEAELGQLAWATQGTTHPDGLRAAPSAGALFPLELYVVLHAGLYHYEPLRHQLRRRAAGDLRAELHQAALAQDAVQQAPAVFVLTAVPERTEQKYGPERSPRYVHIEVGHAAQNLHLQAAALNLASVPVGAFDDERVGNVLALAAGETPLYLVPVGHPAS